MGGKFSPSPAAPNPFQTFLFAVLGAWRAGNGKQEEVGMAETSEPGT